MFREYAHMYQAATYVVGPLLLTSVVRVMIGQA